MEAFDEARNAVDCHYGLLSQESVAYLVMGILVVRGPYMLGDWAVLR